MGKPYVVSTWGTDTKKDLDWLFSVYSVIYDGIAGRIKVKQIAG